MSLYFIILSASFIFPLLLSFDRKVSFYRHWKFVFPSIFLTALFFIIIDIIFTRNGVWGFNPRYHSGILISGLPLEEWLFFILIPYSCLFIHYVYLHYSGGWSVSDRTVKAISLFIIIALAVISAIFARKTYTLVYSVLTILILLVMLSDRQKVLNSYLVSFPIMLIPFFIVNALLTGTFIEDEVVWYSSREIIGLRILTIPVEDFWYSFSLIAMNLLVTEKLRSRFKI
jgi:lycopene cyclase domain-containing protein